MEFRFELGEVVKDKIAGFQGVVMVRSQYYTGCNTYGLLAQSLNKDGKRFDWEWIDETLLVKVENTENVLEKSERDNGGPHPNAPQM